MGGERDLKKKKKNNSGGLCEKGVMCFRVMGDVVGKVLNAKDDPIRMPIRHLRSWALDVQGLDG